MVNKSRVETLSDGIFAIAITLLVLTITNPVDFHHLGHELALRWPSFAAYAVSFGIIGIMWLNHHSLFRHLSHLDRGAFYFNLFLLLTVVFLPYPTGVLGEALHRGHGARVAAIAYSATMTANALGWSGLWLYCSLNRRLLDETYPESRRRPATLAFNSGVVAYAATVGVAFVSAFGCLAFHAALALYYALDPLTRRSIAPTS